MTTFIKQVVRNFNRPRKYVVISCSNAVLMSNFLSECLPSDVPQCEVAVDYAVMILLPAVILLPVVTLLPSRCPRMSSGLLVRKSVVLLVLVRRTVVLLVLVRRTAIVPVLVRKTVVVLVLVRKTIVLIVLLILVNYKFDNSSQSPSNLRANIGQSAAHTHKENNEG